MVKPIQKEIMKLTKIPHPNGRKTAQLLRKTLKLEHRKKVKMSHSMKTNVTAEKYLWFQRVLSDDELCTSLVLLNAINRYLARFDDELEQISLKHEIGGKRSRQHASRQDIINMTKKNEMEEFSTCGIELPDVFNPKQFQLLKKWTGELRFLQNFKLRRFNKSMLESQLERESVNDKENMSSD